MEEKELIVIKQLPIIEDQLLAIKQSVTERVETAMSLVCTEENYKDVKKVRSELNKEFTELEKRRKDVKTKILAPYEQFERVYKECAADAYTRADTALKGKISEVESGLKDQKRQALEEYFTEYRESVGLKPDFVTLENVGLKIGLSDSLTGLKKQIAVFLDRVSSELQAISTDASRDEILVEYQKTFDLAASIAVVNRRHEEIEQARRAREAIALRRQVEAARAAEIMAAAESAPLAASEAPLAAPAVMDAPQEVQKEEAAPVLYTTTFTVTGTIEQLKALKKFLEDGGYQYE